MLTRRGLFRVLGGAAATVALPWFESLTPRAYAAAGPPQRLLFYFVPNGIHMPGWTPAAVGEGFALTPILEPLAALKGDVLVLSGLSNQAGTAGADGAGDHARGTATFLTCRRINKSATDLQNGVSVDQTAAAHWKAQKATDFPSLQLGMEQGGDSGVCDSGYGCAYTSNISWGEKGQVPKLVRPDTAFNLLFGGADGAATQAERERRQRTRKSVLDYVRGQAEGLRGRLSRSDQRKLDEYLTGVREVEVRVSAQSAVQCAPGKAPTPGGDFVTQVRLMADLMVLALQCDRTRVVSFMLGNGGSGRDYSKIIDTSIQGGHHDISHHMGDPVKQGMLQKIDTWEVQQLAYLLQKMKAVKEGDRTLLDNAAVVFGSEISDGNRHNHDDMPVLVAGRLGGALRSGRHLRVAQPVAKLYLTLLQGAGVPQATFGADGDSPLALS